MFLKPFKIKTNHQLKASDKKHLKEEFKKSFPVLTDEVLNELLSKKENVSCTKIETASHGSIQVYVVNKRPMAFLYEDRLYPTVYFLWRCPDNTLLSFTTHTSVVPKLMDGADLMLPGVYYPKFNSFSAEVPAFYARSRACVNTTSNKAAIAIGITAESSDYLCRSQNRGKCVLIYHILGDKLCTLDGMPCLPLPGQGPPDWVTKTLISIQSENVKLEELQISENSVNAENVNQEPNEASASGGEVDSSSEEVTVKDMDELFVHCFLATIKYYDELATPVLASSFFLYMKKMCPTEKSLDIKKSSYKKLSQFLERMAEIGIIELEEEKKGVLTITKIDRKNPKLVEFVLNPAECPTKSSKEQDDFSLSIIESHAVTTPSLSVFGPFGFIRGSVITNTDIRKYVTEYVKLNNLQERDRVKINSGLSSICPGDTSVTWPVLMQKIFKAMSPCYKLLCGGNEIIRKGKLQPINITIAKRCGRKTITLVDNLETFGIKIDEVASLCQHGVAASTSINRSISSKMTDQLQIQGNQVLFIYNLLLEKFKVPKQYVTGLQYAPKQKN